MSEETQYTVSQWAELTFGPAGSILRVAVRANEEMAELLHAISVEDLVKAKEELADVIIVLSRVATRLNCDMIVEVDKKMRINRSREWKLDGTGHGYHK